MQVKQYHKIATKILKSFYLCDRALYFKLKNSSVNAETIEALLKTLCEESWTLVTIDQVLLLTPWQLAKLYRAHYYQNGGRATDEIFEYVRNKGDMSKSTLKNISSILLDSELKDA